MKFHPELKEKEPVKGKVIQFPTVYHTLPAKVVNYGR
jgi:hypothetical protein